MSKKRDRVIRRAATALGMVRGGRRALRRRWFSMEHGLRPRFTDSMEQAWEGNRTERARCYLLVRGLLNDGPRDRLDAEFGIKRRIQTGPRKVGAAIVGVDPEA